MVSIRFERAAKKALGSISAKSSINRSTFHRKMSVFHPTIRNCKNGENGLMGPDPAFGWGFYLHTRRFAGPNVLCFKGICCVISHGGAVFRNIMQSKSRTLARPQETYLRTT